MSGVDATSVADDGPGLGPWAARGLAAAAGLAIMLGLPPWGWWPLTFVGIALLDRVVAGSPRRAQRFWRTGLVAGFWLFPSTIWMLDFSAPGFVLVGVIFSTMFAVAGLVSPQNHWRRLTLLGGFTLVELVRWSWPFGGVPISTLAMTQADAPLIVVARVGGPLLLSFAVMAVGLSLSAVLDGERRWVGAGLGAVVVLVALGLVGPRGQAVGTLDVAVVQGGGEQRTRATASQEPEVFARHLDASEQIVTPVDLVLWPENVVNPKAEGAAADAPGLDKEFATDELAALAQRLDAPVLPGWFEKVSDTETVNYTSVVLPDGTVGDRYDKVRLVPFGEFTPFRSLVEKVAGDSLQARDVIPGTEPAVLEVPGVGLMGISISWEVFFANRGRDAIGNGGEVLLNPTNGSSYWLTIVQSQQVASSRLRAVETGRWVLQAAPTGFSAIIDPNGNVVERTAVSEAQVLQASIERRQGLTWANRVGNWPALIAAIAAMLLGSRRGSARSHDDDRAATVSKPLPSSDRTRPVP